MERLITDIENRPLKRSEWNTHHPFFRWTAKGKGGVFRSFIDHMTVPMTIEPHKALHATVDAPLLPSLTLIHRIRSYTSSLPDNNPYNRIISVTEFLEETAERNGHLGELITEQSKFTKESTAQILKAVKSLPTQNVKEQKVEHQTVNNQE